MLTTLALLATPWHPGVGAVVFVFVLLFLTLFMLTLVAVFGRRGRRGPWGPGPQAWYAAQAVRSAESVLAQRFANGDIDEKEYRARLEVLRATTPALPAK